ncbi:MAG: glycosyltransferase family 4 protein [Pseudomonadota bacterium]
MRILFLVTEDWYFVSHRLPMAAAARDAGFEVHVATRVRDHGEVIAGHGFTVHSLSWQRGSTSAFANLQAVREIRTLLTKLRPALLHNIAMKPVLLGGLAAVGAGHGLRVIHSATGLGSLFIDRPAPGVGVNGGDEDSGNGKSSGQTSAGHTVVASKRRALQTMLGWLCRRPGTRVVVQNADDRAAFGALGVPDARIVLIPGSGVDVSALPALAEPDGPVVAAFVGRMLADKGVETLIQAHRLLRARGEAPKLLLAGTPDPENPTSISPEQLSAWAAEPNVEWRGHVQNIGGVWRDAHIAVLPSLREGLPKSLLEAGASARAMIASDAPGCRDVCRDGVTGLLHPVGDAQALADQWRRLAGDAALRTQFAAQARRDAEEIFAQDVIGAQTAALYRDAIA